MVRMSRNVIGGQIYHVLNRATNRRKIFSTRKDYQEFLTLLALAQKRFPVAIYAFVIMPNHIHLVLSPKEDTDMPRFMHWLFTTHANIYRTKTETIGEGHVYQARYKSFVVEKDEYFFTVLKYVEQNPLRAGLVTRVEDWRWGSAWIRHHGTLEEKKSLLPPSYLRLPENYENWVNNEQDGAILGALRKSVNRGLPYGSDKWVSGVFEMFGIAPPRPRGRPRKQ